MSEGKAAAAVKEEAGGEDDGERAKKTVNLDGLLEQLGSPGKCQMFIYLLMCLNVFPISLNFMAMSFFGAKPNQTCKLPSGAPMNISIPKKADGSYDGCKMYINPYNHSLGTQSCQYGYDYPMAGGAYPITAQWDLVCDKESLGRMAQSVFFAGVMVGGLIFGYLADRFGRRPVILLTVYSQAVLGFITAFSPHLAMFVVFKFFQGMMLQGLQTANTTAVMELFQTKYRTKAGMGIAMLATACSMIIGLISFLIPNWKYMQIAISVPTIITISFIWLLPESLRWLMSNQRLETGRRVAERYSQVNKLPIPDNLDEQLAHISQQITQNSKQGVKSNITDLFKVASLRRSSIILFYLWFTASVVYYGITLSIPNLGGNASLNFFIVGALETTSRFAGYFIINRFGRRVPMSVCYALSGVVCIISGCLSNLLKGSDALQMLSVMLALVGRAAMGQCFAFIALVTSEVFPTLFRTIGSGACSFWSRVGGTVAPYTLLLDAYVGKATPYIAFGSLAIIGGGLTLLLPETLNVPLPDTVKDIKDIHSQNTSARLEEGQQTTKETNNTHST